MLTIKERKERITQLTDMISELQSEDDKSSNFEESTYENAIKGLQGAIAYQERMIEKLVS